MRCQPRYKGQVYICLKNVQTCLLCDEPADEKTPLCVACETELPWLGDHCQRCALPLSAADLTCGECLLEPPAFVQVVVPWRYGFPVEQIIFETVEGEQVSDGSWLAEILSEYKRIGFKTAIDDFGAGFAGLTLLADFQPDIVKLDMALIRAIDQSRCRARAGAPILSR